MDCYIEFAPSGKPSKVLAHNGKESQLYTSLLSVPFIENGSESLDLYGKLVSLDFLKEKHIQDENGEPVLYFMAGNSNVNPIFESFANAKAAYPDSPILTGFAKHGKIQEYNGKNYASMNQFTPIASFANILSDGNTKNDIINNLIVTGSVKGKMSWAMKLRDKVKFYLEPLNFSISAPDNTSPTSNTAKAVTEYLKSKGFPINILSEQQMIEEARKLGYENFSEVPQTLTKNERIYGLYMQSGYDFDRSYSPFKSQDEITKAIMESNIPSEYKDEYQEVLKFEDRYGHSVFVQNNTSFKTSVSPFESEVYAPRQNETFDAYKDRMMEEAISRLLGENSTDYFERIAKEAGLNDKETKSFVEKVKQFILDFADWLGKQLGLTDITPEQLSKMTNKEMFESVITSMLRGDYLDNSTNNIAKESENITLRYDNKGQHLAPNGKPSNLTEQQAKIVRTEAFKNWFGDWENEPENASKIVDENGEPKIVYHGGFEKINEFRPIAYFSTYKIAEQFASPMFRFGDETLYGEEVPTITSAFLNLRNPKKTYTDEQYESEVEGSVDSLKLLREGYDSHIHDNNEGYPYYVALYPNQIKSATENTGTFSNMSNDIRFSIIGERGAVSLNDSLQTMDNLAIAKEMLDKKKSPKAIKNATGWEYSAPENKWKLELDYGTTKDLPQLRELANNVSFNREYVNSVVYKVNSDGTYDVKMYNTEGSGGTEGRKIEYDSLSKEDLSTMMGGELANDIISEKGSDITDAWEVLYETYAEKAFEINKKYKMEVGNAIKLPRIFVAPNLFKAYPKLKDLDVVVHSLKDGEAAWDGENIILSPKAAIKNDKYIRSILIHEVQHFIQDQEGFARGGTSTEMQVDFTYEDEFILGEYANGDKSAMEFLSDSNVKYLLAESPDIRTIIEKKTKLEIKLTLKDGKLNSYDKYKKLAGEVEARNVQARAEMSKAKRLRTLLSETEEIAPEDKIYLYGSMMASSESPLKDKIIAKRKELAKAEIRKQKFEANVAKNTTQQLDMFAPNVRQGNLFEADKSQIQKDYQEIKSDVARISSELNSLINESNGMKVAPNQLDLFAPLNLDTTAKQEIEFKIATNPKYIADALIQGGYVEQDCSI